MAVESRRVDRTAEEGDVGGEAETGQENLEGTVRGDGEPDGADQKKDGKGGEADSPGERRVADRKGLVHGETLSPAPQRSPEKGRKSF